MLVLPGLCRHDKFRVYSSYNWNLRPFLPTPHSPLLHLPFAGFPWWLGTCTALIFVLIILLIPMKFIRAVSNDGSFLLCFISHLVFSSGIGFPSPSWAQTCVPPNSAFWIASMCHHASWRLLFLKRLLNNSPLLIHATTSLSIYPLMDKWIVFIVQLLWLIPRWTGAHRCLPLWDTDFVSFRISEVRLLNPIGVLF